MPEQFKPEQEKTYTLDDVTAFLRDRKDEYEVWLGRRPLEPELEKAVQHARKDIGQEELARSDRETEKDLAEVSNALSELEAGNYELARAYLQNEVTKSMRTLPAVKRIEEAMVPHEEDEGSLEGMTEKEMQRARHLQGLADALGGEPIH